MPQAEWLLLLDLTFIRDKLKVIFKINLLDFIMQYSTDSPYRIILIALKIGRILLAQFV
jgi:hypothetical protein